ncbi:MAG: hypothetical protein WAM97_00535 [Acidimicrobiales bacterium]
MVESLAPDSSPLPAVEAEVPPLGQVDQGSRRSRTHRRLIICVGLVTLAATAALVGAFIGAPQSTGSAKSQAKTGRIINPQRSHLVTSYKEAPAVRTTPTTAVVAPKTTRVPERPSVVTVSVTGPSIAAMVAEVERAGIEPGSNWSWSMGDTETRCGFIPGTGTGCTSALGGVVHTVFGGSPTLALVAHELANAEALNDAVPTLMSVVSAAESGTSWSPTDALASCLVAHFMGFQDASAGTWRCPAKLSTYVAENIHDAPPVVTELTSVCGKTSRAISTLTFRASAGVLTVKGPAIGSVSETKPAGTPVTVSGVGTFTGRDQGGVVTATGICAP